MDTITLEETTAVYESMSVSELQDLYRAFGMDLDKHMEAATVTNDKITFCVGRMGIVAKILGNRAGKV